MHIEIEVKSTIANVLNHAPKPNIAEFSQLFTKWGLDNTVLETLQIHITFCNMYARGEYLGYNDGIHRIEISELYCLFNTSQRYFLEKITTHELRHVWWALQDNPPDDLGEKDCNRKEKECVVNLLWIFENSPTV